MIPCSSPTAKRKLLVRWIPSGKPGCRIGAAPLKGLSMPSSRDDFGVYVHWPFCKAKCPYCDFNSHVRHQDVDTKSFAKALTTELRWFAGITPGRRVSSIFFGGGTPSLMPPAAVAAVIDQI